MNERTPLRYSKHSELGRDERREILTARIQGVDRILSAELPGAKTSRLLDAAACMWTARRISPRSEHECPRIQSGTPKAFAWRSSADWRSVERIAALQLRIDVEVPLPNSAAELRLTNVLPIGAAGSLRQ